MHEIKMFFFIKCQLDRSKFCKFRALIIWLLKGVELGQKDGVHLSGIQMVGLYSIQMAFENQTIWHPTSFRLFENQTRSVFKSPMYVSGLNEKGPNNIWNLNFKKFCIQMFPVFKWLVFRSPRFIKCQYSDESRYCASGFHTFTVLM